MNVMNRRMQILILCIIVGIGIVAIVAGTVTFMNAGARTMETPAERTRNSPLEQPPTGNNTLRDISGYDLYLSAVDVSTGKPLGDVSVYLDGGYEGSTSAQGILGIQNLIPVSEGQHTIRVTKSGYRDYTGSITAPFPSPVNIGLQGQVFVPVQEPGSHDTKIDIVFVPSGTSYNCAELRKINTTLYVTDRNAFVTDVNRLVSESLFTLDTITEKTEPIPPDYRDRFNIYYYYDSEHFADAFNGCAGTVPENFWDTVPFADVVIILYPTYPTRNSGPPCEPNGCVNPGTGRSWMKIAADREVLFMHECGHAIFGLVDTYCGSTEYRLNEPFPNVWTSRESCVMDATNNSWDTLACRQIEQKAPADCIKQFWRWDPDPDIMREGYSGTFGKASTLRITYIFSNFNAWGETA